MIISKMKSYRYLKDVEGLQELRIKNRVLIGFGNTPYELRID
jgi:hypothetical protein